MGNQKIISMRPQGLPLRHQNAKWLENSYLIISEYEIALSQFDNRESKNHVDETSGPTFETPECKNWFKNTDLIISEYQIALSQIDKGASKNYVPETSGPTFETPGSKNDWKIPIL